MPVHEVLVIAWRSQGAAARHRGEPRSWNPALEPSPLDTASDRMTKRRAWWAGWDKADGLEPSSRLLANCLPIPSGPVVDLDGAHSGLLHTGKVVHDPAVRAGDELRLVR